MIRLVKPSPEMEADAEQFKNEHYENGETVIHGSSLYDRMESYGEWLAHLESSSKGEKEGWVRSSTFFGVRESDGRIVGVIDIRHELNDFLRNVGGHIGYGVRPSERRRGYASEMLRLALLYARDTVGLRWVMLSCDANNIASAGTILKNGGVLERESVYDGCPLKIFRIELGG